MDLTGEELNITIILRIHNRKQYFKEAAESIIHQKFPNKNVDILILTNVKEASEYFETLKEVRSSVYFYEKGNEGEVLSQGIKESTGSILCFLDDDDLWENDKLLVVSNAFKRFENLGYFHNGVVPFSSIPSRMKRRVYERKPRVKSLYVSNAEKTRMIRSILGYYPDFNLSSVCISRKLMSRRIEELAKIKTSPDTFIFYCALESKYGLLLDERPLTFYRHHEGHSSASDPKNENWNKAVMESHKMMYDIFSKSEPCLRNISRRRVALTTIQTSILTGNTTIKDSLKNFLAYVGIFLNSRLPIDFLVIFLYGIFMINKDLARKIYFRFM